MTNKLKVSDLPKFELEEPSKVSEQGTYKQMKCLNLYVDISGSLHEDDDEPFVHVDARLHRPSEVEAHRTKHTCWIEAVRYERDHLHNRDKYHVRSESTIFMSVEQMRSLRDRLNTLDLDDPDTKPTQ